jgi:hypothetical protein
VRVRSHALPAASIVLLWLALGVGLSRVTRLVADWFVMTDELLYERLALSIDRLGTPLPHVHGEVISNVNQLYPLLLAIVFRHGFVLHGFHEAHVMNAFVMTSAAIPAYLLAHRVTGHRLLSLAAGAATASVIWMTLASFLLTEVAAYPAFVWAIYAAHASMSRPGPRTDALAVAAIVLAVLARTQLYVVAAILPVAIVGHGIATQRLRAMLRSHMTLLALYGVGLLGGLAVTVSGAHVLGTYSSTASGNPFPLELWRSAPVHLAVVALSVGIAPLLIGGGWAVGNLRRSDNDGRQAFAWLAVVSIVALTIEVASFDLRFGGGVVRDRYLFYLAPVLFVALAAGLSSARPPRWSIAVPLVLFAIGISQAALPTFQKLNADTPASAINDWLLSTMQGLSGARTFLILVAAVLALAYVEATVFVGARVVAAFVGIVLVFALPAQTAYGFKRLFAVNGTSGLPLTLDQSVVFGWVDREINTENQAVMIPYPILPSDYWANAGFWWDLEFWNRAVVREAGRPNEFSGTPPGSFPKLDLRFDPRTGRANVDLDMFVAQAVVETRFHIAGTQRTNKRNVNLVAPERPWRADWITYGLYDDGWTRPHTVAHIRIFASPGQRAKERRGITLRMAEPERVPPRAVILSTNAGRQRIVVGPSGSQNVALVCVPPHGYADVSVRVDRSSPIGGDPKNLETLPRARDGGIWFQQIALADEIGTC